MIDKKYIDSGRISGFLSESIHIIIAGRCEVMKRRILITILVVLLAVTGITSFAYGERTEPYYAYSARTFAYEVY